MDKRSRAVTIVRRATRILLATSVLIVAVLAFVVSTATVPSQGLTGGDVGLLVGVDPGGPVWRDGIRSGELVVELQAGDEPGGWRLVTLDGTTEHVSSTAGHVARLRAYEAWSVVALAMALLTALPVFRGHPVAAPLLPVTLAITAQPLFFSGIFVAALVAGALVFLGGAVAIPAFASWRWWMGPAVAAGAGLALAWVFSILVDPALFDIVDTARLPAAAGFSVLGLITVFDRERFRESRRRIGPPQFVDLVYLAAAAAFLAAAGGLGRAPIELLAVAVVIALAIYPIWRHDAIGAFERFVTSSARRDAAILAIEDERGRLARDIHDAPLQDLSAVIRRLDNVPGAAQEAEALREVAARLRDVATALRPPVLQDLGLVAAIHDLRDTVSAANPNWEVTVDVDEATGDRPPADVELAALRVLQEAATNSIAHSKGRQLKIRGSVTPASIELQASDDGRGYGEVEARDARRAGHFGLDSMRERAEAVSAEATVASTPEGVTVTFRWAAG